jgi:hypothetical protein
MFKNDIHITALALILYEHVNAYSHMCIEDELVIAPCFSKVHGLQSPRLPHIALNERNGV